jgi:hypothetical protein
VSPFERKMSTLNRNWPNWLPHLLWGEHKCPRCNSLQFKPAESWSSDSLLSMFALRPVRCMFCWRRYYWFAVHAVNQA